MASTISPHDGAPEHGVPDHDAPTGRSLVFRAGGRVYTCPVEAVRAVFPRGGATRLPGAPAQVLGLVNVRGTIVTVVDGGLCLHGRPSDPTGQVMLVDAGVRGVGLAVDTVADVRALRADEEYQVVDVRAAVACVVAISEDE